MFLNHTSRLATTTIYRYVAPFSFRIHLYGCVNVWTCGRFFLSHPYVQTSIRPHVSQLQSYFQQRQKRQAVPVPDLDAVFLPGVVDPGDDVAAVGDVEQVQLGAQARAQHLKTIARHDIET